MTDLVNAAGEGDLQISAYLDKADQAMPHLELMLLGAKLSSTLPSASMSAEVWENATQLALTIIGSFKEEKDGVDSKYSLALAMVPTGDGDAGTISVFLKDGSSKGEIGFSMLNGTKKVIEASAWGSLDSINMSVQVSNATSNIIKTDILDSKASSSDDFDVLAYVELETKRQATVEFDWVLATGKLSVKADKMPGTKDNASVEHTGTYLLSAADPSVRSAEGTVKANDQVVTKFKGSASNGNEASPATGQLEVWDDNLVAAPLFKVVGQMTTLEQSFIAPKRIILLNSPVAGSVTLDVRNGTGSDRLVDLKLGVKEEKLGNGSKVTGSGELVSPLSETPLMLTMVFDTSTPTKMALSADLVTDGESVMSLKGDCPYSGSYMEGDVALKMGNESQVIHLKASKGFLPQKMKESGYDALWLNLGTTIDKARIDLSDLYFERGPDVAWSGVGWKFKLCDVDGDTCKEVYHHSFDIDFVAGKIEIPVGKAKTAFASTLSLTDMSSFSMTGLIDSVAAASGIPSTGVVVEDISFQILTKVAFDPSVTKEQAVKTVAKANDVGESEVVLTVAGRRLDPSDVGRRLAAVEYDSMITVKDVIKATAVMASSADVTLLTAVQKEIAPAAPAPKVTEAPAVKIVCKFDLVSETDKPVEVPSDAAMSSKLSATLGTTVTADVDEGSVSATLQTENGAAPVAGFAQGRPDGTGIASAADLAAPAAALFVAALSALASALAGGRA